LVYCKYERVFDQNHILSWWALKALKIKISKTISKKMQNNNKTFKNYRELARLTNGKIHHFGVLSALAILDNSKNVKSDF
jgi:hypothetical protein